MAPFRKKPVVIEATQWFNDHPEDNREMFHTEESGDFLGEGKVVRYYRTPALDGQDVCKKCLESTGSSSYSNQGRKMHDHGWIDTLEGGHIVCPGDWIITGVQGERYPCKPDIFEATYEDADCQAVRDTEHEECIPWEKVKWAMDENTVPHWVAMVLYSALDDIDTADDMAKGDEGLYRNLVRRYNQERHKVAECDGYTVKFHAMAEQPEEVIGDFVPAPQYVKRLHNLVASMVQHIQSTKLGGPLHAFDQAWLSTFDDPDSFPEVTKIVKADKS